MHICHRYILYDIICTLNHESSVLACLVQASGWPAPKKDLELALIFRI